MKSPNHPPRLHVGAGPNDGSAMCAMQVISWEAGDKKITDTPRCVDELLARVVQAVNDTLCQHRFYTDECRMLCPECSLDVLALAHRVVGTSAHGLDDDALHKVWKMMAREAAARVAHLAPDNFHADQALKYARSTSAAAAHAAYAIDNAASASGLNRLSQAHGLIDRFAELTGLPAKPLPVAA